MGLWPGRLAACAWGPTAELRTFVLNYPLGRRSADRQLCASAERLPANRVDGVPAPRVHQHRQGPRRPCGVTPRRIGLGDHPAGAHGVHGPRGPGRSRRKDSRRPVLPLGTRRHRTHPGRPPHARGRPGRPGTDPDRRRQSQWIATRASPRSTRTRTSRSGCSIPSPPRVASSRVLDRLRSRQPSHAQQAHGDGQRPGDRRRTQHERSLLRGGPRANFRDLDIAAAGPGGPGSVSESSTDSGTATGPYPSRRWSTGPTPRRTIVPTCNANARRSRREAIRIRWTRTLPSSSRSSRPSFAASSGPPRTPCTTIPPR